jgi:cobalt-zinc-cadmium efflux system outer membrane protein
MRVIPVFLSLVLVSPAFAQAPVPTLSQGEDGATLTLRDVLDEAFERNPELVALRRGHQAMAARPLQVRAIAGPSPEAQICEGHVPESRDEDVERHRIGVRTNEVLEEVRQVFAELALAREAQRLHDDHVPVLRDIADAATYRYAAGHSGQHDSMAAIAELSRLQGAAVAWRNRARRAEARLNGLLGRAMAAPVAALMAQTLTVIPFEPTRVALERHPAVAQANAVIAREETTLALLQGGPRVDGIQWPDVEPCRLWLARAINAQRLEVAAAAARREAVLTGVRLGVRDAELRLDTARERVGLMATTVLPHAEHAFDVARSEYAASRGAFDHVIASQRALLDTRVEYAEVRGEFERALAALERAMGDARDDRWPAPRPVEGAQP